MPSVLEAAGVGPAQVDVVVHTHLHFDHIGGDVTAGEPFLPKARILIHRAEVDHWFGLDDAAGRRVREHLEPVADRIETFEGDVTVVRGVSTTETFGHTPGHVSIGLVSEGRRAVISGDVTHHPLQAQHPEWNIFADLDQATAVATRRAFFDGLAGGGSYLAAGHYPRPGFGTVEVHESQRVFVPAPVTEL
jgi:glyoxylase-like metal-dependent hydrolase (beta-lactamase superfamily II)